MQKQRFLSIPRINLGLAKSWWLLALAVSSLAAALVVGSGVATVDAQPVSVGPSAARVTTIPLVAPLEKKSTLLIVGSGFEPNQEIFIAVRSADGILTEISGRVEPPVFSANEDGAFATTWDLGRWAKKKIGTEGIYSLQVVNGVYELTASSPLALCEPKKLEAVFCSEAFLGR